MGKDVVSYLDCFKFRLYKLDGDILKTITDNQWKLLYK